MSALRLISSCCTTIAIFRTAFTVSTPVQHITTVPRLFSLRCLASFSVLDQQQWLGALLSAPTVADCCGGLGFFPNGSVQLGAYNKTMIQRYRAAGFTVMPTFGGNFLPLAAWQMRKENAQTSELPFHSCLRPPHTF